MALKTSHPRSSFSLNPRQLEAVQAVKGPLLISAGAGSGKTQVLTSRIAHILSQGLAAPNEIFAVTFTNKAAREMSERILKQIRDIPVFEPLWISTFHSACARILRENISHLNPPRKRVIIYDDSDQLSLVKKIMKENKMDESHNPPKSLKNQINLCKRMALSPEKLEYGRFRLRFSEDFPRFYEAYENSLITAEAFDFEGLIFETHKLLSEREDILSHYQNKFKFISVDEYQDTNHIQYLLIYNLAKKHKNICVVGDEDQSIYSWRGADISNILNFEKDFPGCRVIKLEQNYRSTNTIVSAASSLIANNTSRKDKTLFTHNCSGEKIKIQACFNEIQEARLLAGSISHLCSNDTFSHNDFAIFYRTNAQSRIIEDQLRMKSIPYQIIGSLKFYERAEIKDMLSYLRLILNDKDEVSLRRIINSPRRGIGKAAIEKAGSMSFQKSIPLSQALLETASLRKNTKSSQAILEFFDMMQDLREQSKNLTLSKLYMELLKKSLYLETLSEQRTIEAESKIQNLDEFMNAIEQFQIEKKDGALLESFLEEMALISSTDQGGDLSSVKLLTLHLSKGLEFNVVFITGLEEGLLPLTGSIEEMDVEEERRLAYVGMTRARKQLFLSYALNRRRFGVEKKQTPSRFLKEISKDCLHPSKPRGERLNFYQKPHYLKRP